jgi:disulfide oxidoreductase YuzD
MARRFGDAASIEYVDTSDLAQHEAHTSEIATIREKALLYPVTFIDGDPVYDGAVSYPAIVRTVAEKLTEEV